MKDLSIDININIGEYLVLSDIDGKNERLPFSLSLFKFLKFKSSTSGLCDNLARPIYNLMK